MEAIEPVNAARSYLNTLTSKQVRLGFFGMTRKDPSQPLDTLLGFTWILVSLVNIAFDHSAQFETMT